MRCGDFGASEAFRRAFANKSVTSTQLANISGYLRENPSVELTEHIIPYLEKLPTPSVAEKAVKLLKFFAASERRPGRLIQFDVRHLDDQMRSNKQRDGDHFVSDPPAESADGRGLPLLGAAWAEDQGELEYLFQLLKDQERIEDRDHRCIITGIGWDFLQTRRDSGGNTCFVAMSFSKGLENIWTGPISEGIRNAGYNPSRVDNKEHNNDITDEIIAGIRTSRFLLADFTDHRPGVYYEAGFAAGLEKPVVRTIRADQVNELHFDTRQLNHILWRRNGLEIFSKAITARIVATIGQGPVPNPPGIAE